MGLLRKTIIFYFIPAYSSFFSSKLNKIFFYNIFNPLFMLYMWNTWLIELYSSGKNLQGVTLWHYEKWVFLVILILMKMLVYTVMLKDVWLVQDLWFNLFSTHATDRAGYFNCYIAMKDENLLKDLCLLKEVCLLWYVYHSCEGL